MTSCQEVLGSSDCEVNSTYWDKLSWASWIQGCISLISLWGFLLYKCIQKILQNCFVKLTPDIRIKSSQLLIYHLTFMARVLFQWYDLHWPDDDQGQCCCTHDNERGRWTGYCRRGSGYHGIHGLSAGQSNWCPHLPNCGPLDKAAGLPCTGSKPTQSPGSKLDVQ